MMDRAAARTPPQVPSSIEEVEAESRRGLVFALSIVFVVVSAYFAVNALVSYGVALRPWTVICVTAVPFFGACALLARDLRTTRAATHLLLVCFGTLIVIAGLMSGLVVATGPWTACAVLLAAVLLGPRWAVGFSLAVTAGLLGLDTLYDASGGDPRWMRVPSAHSLIASSLAVVTLTLAVTMMYERTQRKARDGVAAMMRELAESHAKLQAAHGELRQLYERTVAQERLSSLGMLAAGVAHEINNPMSFITSNVHSLLMDFDTIREDPAMADEYRRDVLPATMDGIKRVNAIVSDLRRFARGDPEALVEYALDEQVETAVRLVRQHFRDGANLVLALAAPTPALGRPAQIVQVIINLLVNARQALPGPGTVTVRTFEDDANVVVEVRDTGVGMTEEIRSRLWEPFFTTKPVGVGTGLGLPVVHGIVQDHGGVIEVDSTLGQGATFTVRLPRQPLPRVARAVGFNAMAPAVGGANAGEGAAKAA